ncbi:MAG: membrane protein insertase YidC [Halocynthiibacter sp.]
MDDQNKNLLLASVLSFAVIAVWYGFIAPPEEPIADPNAPAAVTSTTDAIQPSAPPAQTEIATATNLTNAPTPSVIEAERIKINTPRLTGAISTVGGRIDDLLLKNYQEELADDSELVRLLSPQGSDAPYYALHGWGPAGGLSADQVPGFETIWGIEGNDTLTTDHPVTLVWDNGSGLKFRRVISIDDDYLFTVTQSVENTMSDAARLYPYGLIARHGEPDVVGFFILHEGVVRMSDGELQEIDYDDMPDMNFSDREGARVDAIQVADDGWVGFTDKYWMTALAPAAGQSFTSVAKYIKGADVYTTESRLPVMDVAAGATVSVTTQVFAGAKEWETIKKYEDNGIKGFIDSIDWGWFFFLTKPIFKLLHFINGLIGNMGWAIILLTLCIKAVLLPLAYKSYVSMAKMKELQPEMEKIKEAAGDDKQKQQKEVMALYKREKVNPAAGCLPILLQIPIFFSLYKVIFVTIELRHAPFIGWIKDLSAPDPTSILNLFGLLPWGTPEPGSMFFILSLGVLPILLGISMWLQQKLNPTPTDPAQAMIFAWMPWVFMFMLGSFASGLVIYWIANNTITFTQQYLIMRSHGSKPDVFGNIKKGFKRKKKAE